MDLLSWYRRFRSPASAPPSGLQTTRAKADGGDADAQFALGIKYGSGHGAAPDFAQAAHWYGRAADQNHGLAQFNLGMMLLEGQGTPRDDVAALVWFRKSAEGGDGGAQQTVGLQCHRSSMGASRQDASESRIEAYKWLHLSAEQGYTGSDAARERVTLDMTREEVTEGNLRATAFAARTS